MNVLSLQSNVIDLQQYLKNNSKKGSLNNEKMDFPDMEIIKNPTFDEWLKEKIIYSSVFDFSEQSFYVIFSILKESVQLEIIEQLLSYSCEGKNDLSSYLNDFDDDSIESDIRILYQIGELSNSCKEIDEEVKVFKTNLILKYEKTIQKNINRLCEEYLQELIDSGNADICVCDQTGHMEITGISGY